MFDFFMISTRSTKRGVIEIYPKFIAKKSSELMIRGGDFYAVWDEEQGLWSTDEQDVQRLIDRELDRYAEENRQKFDSNVKVLHMWDAETGMIDVWHHYCQRQLRDSFHILDEKLIFANDVPNKKDYASKKLSYPLVEGDYSSFDKLISTLYSEEERHKIEWAIGAILTGDAKKIQKFMVLYGEGGTGKSTIIDIIQLLFDGYCTVFDAKALGSSTNAFALEAFRTNPLVAVQHDGDLSKIEDNTRLNSLVSHELMTVNEKFKATYPNRFKCFLIMGTNKPVKITDAKSGLIRRLIDVSPSGNLLRKSEYDKAKDNVKFELGAIAYHCREVYLSDPGKYDNYIPVAMLGATNDFYSFVVDSYHIFSKEDGTTLKIAWEMYRTYCDDARVSFPYSQRMFKEELKNYFREYKERCCLDDGSRVRSYYIGFRTDKFEDLTVVTPSEEKEESKSWIELSEQLSIFDTEFADYPAQYASKSETPTKAWANVKTKLKSIDSHNLHYVKVPEQHVVIDFDIPDENGNKSLDKNLAEASKWPETYAEVSKSGAGLHLHYNYTGDISKLNRVVSEHVEVKLAVGKSSLRRKLTLCNAIAIATISSGLPLKGEKMVNFEGIKSEKALRTLIVRNLRKEIHAYTKPSIDFIYDILEKTYASGMHYDVSDMRNAILTFALGSSHNSEYCAKIVNKMKFHSDEISEPDKPPSDIPIVFFDIEVFPNLFLVNWKLKGEKNPVIRMINPGPSDIEDLMKYRLIGFNCRRYDNHLLYARLMGYTNSQLYNLSQKIINGGANCFFGEAYNVSYTDVYDFASSVNKKSLKKFEIELGIHHQELGLPWDKPVPEEMWTKVAEYCDNDVIATEAVFNHLKADWTARLILADVAGMTPNDTTNSLTTRIIFGKERKPHSAFNYRFMGDIPKNATHVGTISETAMFFNHDDYTLFDSKNRPVFPGYTYDFGKSIYRDEEVGEGGYVYSEPGMYSNVALLDIASMHPSSIIAENLFGDEYTKRFREIRDARIAIKHKDFEAAKKMLGGKLAKYLTDEGAAADLASALKTAINSVYGLTSAAFENPFRDLRNVDNIVAKRGALFMINLKHLVQERGFTVAHIKTDSIKIPDATPEIIQFVMDYGAQYGYTFEHEDTYERMCLVNNAVYIAKYKNCHVDKKTGKKTWWTATGTQFAVPYVFKSLFSREPIIFDDMCETKATTTSIYLDFNEDLPEDEHNYIFVGKVGRFCPIKSGCGGAKLLREGKDKEGEVKYSSITGAKDFRWMESEMVQTLEKEDCIDRSYYETLITDAVYDISQYGDFEWFVSDDTNLPNTAIPWELPCKNTLYRTCTQCPNYHSDEFDHDCKLGYDISQMLKPY